MVEALQVVVVGHVNAGKTTLVRTLARQADFGVVGVLPGSTACRASAIDGQGIAWVDTPGFEDPVALAARWDARPWPSPLERLQALLREPEVERDFPNEFHALNAALGGDALLWVVDSVELVLPKHRHGLALLQACGRPLLMVLLRASHPQGQAAAWMQAAADHGLGPAVPFDAARPQQAWPALLQRLSALLQARRPGAAADLVDAWQVAQQRRQQTALPLIAEALVDLAARRETLPASVAGDAALREQAGTDFRDGVLAAADAAWATLVAQHGFAGHAPPGGGWRSVALRADDDLFNREVLKDAGGKLSGGAAIGAAIGLGADVALAGLSLGAGTAIGAAVGGAAGQGFSTFSRKVLNRLTGQLDLSVEDGVLVALADRLLALLQALQTRGHGASGPWLWPLGHALDAAAQAAVLDALRPARGHPQWSAHAADHQPEAPGRRRAVDAVAALLGGLPQRAWADQTPMPPTGPTAVVPGA